MNDLKIPDLKLPSRVIKTARSLKSINAATKKGFWPLVKKLKPSKKIKIKYRIIQNKVTGEIINETDYRGNYFDPEKFNLIIDWSYYYPYNFKSPYAAYLIPKDIQVGEIVYLEDLIEDFISMSWNQGDAYRLEGSQAKWNGKDFDIKPYARRDRLEIIG